MFTAGASRHFPGSTSNRVALAAGRWACSIALVLLAASGAIAGPATDGQWRGGVTDMGDNAVHSVLLRGASDSFHWMWWNGHPGVPTANYYIWNYVPGYNFSFDTKNAYNIPQPGNAFCAGHVQIANGQLLLAGGQEGNGIEGQGATTAYKFEPLTNTFTALAPMSEERYYPAATFLPNGRVMMTGGGTYEIAAGFGGRASDGVHNDLHSMALVPSRSWLDEDEEGPATGTPPTNLEGQTGVMDQVDGHRILYFGGREQLAGGGTAVHAEVWSLRGNTTADAHEVEWTWSLLTTDGDPALGGLKPAARFEHAAAFSNSRMYIYGGSDGTNALGDLWMLDMTATPNPRWTRLYNWQSGSTGPSPRWGHSMITPKTGLATFPGVLYIFGGRDESQFRSDDNWSFDPYLVGTEDDPWLQGASSGTPRIDHVAAALDVMVNIHFPPASQMLIYGGRGPSGQVLGDTKLYYYPNTGNSYSNTWVAGPGFGPPARAGAAAFSYFDAYSTTVTLHGGQLGSDAYASDAWIYVDKYQTWYACSTGGGPGARANHTLTLFSNPDLNGGNAMILSARNPEVCDPAGTTGGLPGAWTDLPSSANRLMSAYSDMFLLPNGKVFDAGPDPATKVLDPVAGTWGSLLSAVSGHPSGCAVQYRPGSFMRCGGGHPATGTTETIAFDANGNTSGWQLGVNDMLPRDDLNLTILPTGEVLASGGALDYSDGGGYQHPPQIWNPDTRTWGPALAPDPANRAYHSTMVLLPDGRLASAGGFEGANVDAHDYSIYEPYYLFNADGTPIQTQPTITSAPTTLDYGGAFSIGTANPSLVTSVCLVRPTATTHTVNFDQRYLALTFWNCGSGLRAMAPSGAATAPPGNYMLFIVETINGRKVPSIAKWVKLPDTSADQDAPAQVNLDVIGGCDTWLVLGWVAPAANGSAGTGTASEYDLRMSTSAITAQNFDCAARITAPAPSAPGSMEQLTVTGLTCGRTYYFAIKSRDAVVQWSPMSNLATGHTICLRPHQFCADEPPMALRGEIPASVELSSPEPNPAAAPPAIRYGIPSSRVGEHVDVSVFDAAGRRVATLWQGAASPGTYSIAWDLRGSDGSTVRSGVYFLRLQVGATTLTRTLVTTH